MEEDKNLKPVPVEPQKFNPFKLLNAPGDKLLEFKATDEERALDERSKTLYKPTNYSSKMDVDKFLPNDKSTYHTLEQF